MPKEVIEHTPLQKDPFIKLSDIQLGRRMKSQLCEEVVACSPIDVDGGSGSYFNTVYEQEGNIFVRTMMGRSDKRDNVWVYARDEATELKTDDPNYQRARDLLDAA